MERIWDMGRIRLIGLCVLAVFAFTAFAASSAHAGEIGKCVKATHGTGRYVDKYCATLATVEERELGKTNNYEWAPNTGKIPFTSESGESKLKGAAGEIVCKHGSNTGEILNATQNKEVFTFYECSLQPFALPCKNAEVEGKPVIVTYPLASKLLDHGEKGPSGEEPAPNEVWNVLSAEGSSNPSFAGPGPWLAAFECGPVPFAVSGSVSSTIPAKYIDAKINSGKSGKKGKPGKPTYEEDYTALGGEQDLVTTFFNPETSKVESGASIQEGTNLVIIDPLSKGIEISGGATGEAAPATGSVVGTITETPANPAAGAIVSICRTVTDCYSAETKNDGTYKIDGVTVGSYLATVFPPANSPDGEVTSPTPFSVTENATTTEPFTLLGPTPVPPGTAVVGNGMVKVGGQEYPQIFWQTASPLSTQACEGGTVTVEVIAVNTQTGMPEATPPVLLEESPHDSGSFSGSLPAVFPLHGEGKVVISPTGCSLVSEEEPVEFTIYIDPSGEVVDGNKGNAPLADATVTLEKSTSETGTFVMVPEGSPLMDDSNKVNSDVSSPAGLFGWNVAAGFWYKVRASKGGCGETSSAAYYIGAPVMNLKLVLACTPGLEIFTSSLEEGTRGQVYNEELEAVNGVPPYKWKKVTALPKGLKLSKAGVLSGTPKETLAAGTYPIKVKVSDSGKKETKQTVEKEFSLILK